ncbi:MAG TPA: selenocysteine-specific translation elongation factor [Bryobacteraceae bacterium]|nr:selenocysteine-specific translation elongation factor [Bryobacteraceae bacterium]
MKHVVAGTAGHIDHGKTALVRALTGIDTDRLEEEKRRGISIDIGFAHLDLPPGVRVAFVDVPGHERFIKNMLAGIGGIDLLMLVVAADSSIQPQTREHFDICRLLGIRRGFVALTKTDLVDDDIASLVRLEIEELVAGSFLEGAPVVPVSSRTGRGLEDIKRTLYSLAASVPGKDTHGYFRLPIDRSFTMRGFGTVVTGTLISGQVAVEQEVEAHPGARRLRVRGIQVHGSPADRALAGQRTALNLAGADHDKLRRGMVLAEAGVFRETRTVDCAVELLESARALKHRAPVHFHSGTAEIEAEIRRVAGTAAFEPGRREYARIVLREPALLLPGDRFILRMFSPVVTIAGGIVLDALPPHRTSEARLQAVEADAAAAFVREAPFGMSRADLIARTARRDLPEREWFIDDGRARELRSRWRDALAAFHKRNPLSPGMPKEQLRGAAPPHVFEMLLRDQREMVTTAELARLASHNVALREDESAALAKIEAAFERAGLRVPAVPEVLAGSGVDPSRGRSLLQILLRDKRLVRINDELVFHKTALAALRDVMAQRKGQRFGVPEFKEWTGISRKYAIPLLEMLDREKVTRREGDSRVVL